MYRHRDTFNVVSQVPLASPSMATHDDTSQTCFYFTKLTLFTYALPSPESLNKEQEYLSGESGSRETVQTDKKHRIIEDASLYI